MIRFAFNERKAAQAAAYVLDRCGGRLPYIKLIKLLYLADRETLTRIGRTITGDKLVSMKHGPVLSFVYDLISSGPEPDADASPWFQHVSPADGYDVRLVAAEPDVDELSQFETDTLNRIVTKYGRMDRWALVRLVHDLPEWHDPGSSSSDIDPEEILKAEGWEEGAIEDAKITARESRLISLD